MVSISVCDDDKLELKEINKLVNEFLSAKHVQFEIHAFDSSINLLYELSDNHLSDIYILDQPVEKGHLLVAFFSY